MNRIIVLLFCGFWIGSSSTARAECPGGVCYGQPGTTSPAVYDAGPQMGSSFGVAQPYLGAAVPLGTCGPGGCVPQPASPCGPGGCPSAPAMPSPSPCQSGRCGAPAVSSAHGSSPDFNPSGCFSPGAAKGESPRSEAPNRAAMAGSLVMPGVNLNPGFQYAVALGVGHTAACAGTLVKAKSGYCGIATADHCFQGVSNLNCKPIAGSNPELNVCSGISAEVPGLGAVAAKLVRYRETKTQQFSLNGGPMQTENVPVYDVAMMIVPCKEKPKEMEVVAVAAKNAVLCDKGKAGKIMSGGSGPGLYEATREPNNYGEGTLFRLDPRGKNEKGDSGSSLLCEIDGKQAISGIQSRITEDGASRYMTGKALELLRADYPEFGFDQAKENTMLLGGRK